MGKELKNVIVLRNMYSNMFEEVIFILKKEIPETSAQQIGIVDEAKKIIDDYINKAGEVTSPKRCKQPNLQIVQELTGYEKGKKLNVILNICLVLAIALLGIMFMNIINS